MQYAQSAAAFLEVVSEPRGTALRRGIALVLALIPPNLGPTSFRDVVVRRTSDGEELLRRGILQSAEWVVDEMRRDLPKRDVDGFLERWSESELFLRE